METQSSSTARSTGSTLRSFTAAATTGATGGVPTRRASPFSSSTRSPFLSTRSSTTSPITRRYSAGTIQRRAIPTPWSSSVSLSPSGGPVRWIDTTKYTDFLDRQCRLVSRRARRLSRAGSAADVARLQSRRCRQPDRPRRFSEKRRRRGSSVGRTRAQTRCG